ncbi:YdcF family protein [Paenibacillus sp. S-38]|uniref:YdcF family protein n=1 Tax=Paenibacillus sp. S-38 TaxID=3416710 RepID=UPI003CFA1FA1
MAGNEKGGREMKRPRKRRGLLRMCLTGAVLATVWVGWHAWLIWTYDPGPKRLPSDAAVVLGAAVWGEEPSPVFKERIRHGIALYQEGLVRKIIFTGGRGEKGVVAESQAAERYALEQGVPQADILIETRSVITEENLRYAFALGTSHGLRSYTIVSDPLHLRRSMRMAEDLGMEADASAAPTTVYRSWRTKVPFGLREVFYDIGYVITKPLRGW